MATKITKNFSLEEFTKSCTADRKCIDNTPSPEVKNNIVRLVKEMVEKGEIQCGQLIWEYGNKKNPNWIHISLPRRNKPNNQILYLYS